MKLKRYNEYTTHSKINESFSFHGNKNGRPLLFLHGGPGYRCDEGNLSYFDLNKFQVIFLNQRGSSSSSKPASIENNTTQHLIKDIENVRKYLGVESLEIYGQSWGVTLALAYAISYPDRVKGLFLKGVFLGRQKDIDWLYSYDKLGNYSPEIREQFIKLLIEPLGIDLKSNVLDEYSKVLLKSDYDPQLAINWALWEDINCGNNSSLEFPTIDDDYRNVSKAIARIEVHYFKNKCFLPENYILSNISKINCPVTIFQGKEDRICPKYQAEELYSGLKSVGKKCSLHMASNTGHSTSSEMLELFREYII